MYTHVKYQRVQTHLSSRATNAFLILLISQSSLLSAGKMLFSVENCCGWIKHVFKCLRGSVFNALRIEIGFQEHIVQPLRKQPFLCNCCLAGSDYRQKANKVRCRKADEAAKIAPLSLI